MQESPSSPSSAHAVGSAAVRIRRSGDDLDAARVELPPLYEGTSWRADTTGQPFSYRYAAAGDRGMSLRTSSMRGSLVGDIPPGDELVVQWITAGPAVVDTGRDVQQMVRGVPLLFPADETFVFRFEDYDQRLVHLDRGLVAEVAAEQGELRAGSLRFDHTARLAVDAVDAVDGWRRAVAEVSSTLGSGTVTPLLWAGLTRATAVAFLRLYPAQGEPLPPQLLHPRHAALRAAVEFVHENAHLPLTATQIARSAGLSVRGVQVAFQTVLDRSPMTYLREVRLDRVRDELRAADADVTTVAGVARAWGFGHAGHFSAAYAERFGEFPKETLRRSR